MRAPLFSILSLGVAALHVSCASTRSIANLSATPETEVARDIVRISHACADAWNRGDLKAYLTPYSDDVVMVYQSGPEKGRALLEARLRKAQRWNGQRPENLSRIGHSKVSLLDRDYALQIAEIIIQEPAGDVHLWATAILKRTDRRWIVVHEQSF
jgi:uncharacterized protein (TIGR02246 family)